MYPKYLTVVAEFQAKPGKEEELRRELLALVEPTRGEKGCVQYDVHEEQGKPGHFLFYENWTSRAELDAHADSAHLKRLFGLVGGMVTEEPRILFFDRIA
jgi:quinol monooxygenase YgiN